MKRVGRMGLAETLAITTMFVFLRLINPIIPPFFITFKMKKIENSEIKVIESCGLLGLEQRAIPYTPCCI